MKQRLVGWVDTAQLRSPALAQTIAVVRRYLDDRGGRLSATVAYYAFFSVFPALLAMVSITGFVLESHPEWRDDIVDSAIGSFPVIGAGLADSSLGGSGWALAVGLGAALWAGSGAMLATQYAVDEIWNVPVGSRRGGVIGRLRGMALLVLFGLAIVGASVLTNIVTRLSLPGLADLGIIVANLGVNIGAGVLAFRILALEPVGWRDLLPGAVVAGTGFLVLHSAGSIVIDRYVENSSETYGTFAVVIGLLVWFHLLAQVTLVGAELNVVRHRSLYPDLLGDDPADDA